MNGAGAAFGRRLFAIALAAFFLRLAVRLVTGVGDYWTNGYTHYQQLAASLVAGHGYAFPGEAPTAFRVPLYPMFIAAVTWGNTNPWVLVVAQSIVSSALAVIAGLTARRLFNPAAGLAAAALCA
ncbi:MAG: hypothetical protein ABIT16_11095, partial [Croceibacterium sp.]